MRSHFIDHLGRKVFFMDYHGAGAAEVAQELEGIKPLVAAQPKDSMLGLVDAEGLQVSAPVLAMLTQSAIRGRGKYTKVAVFGLSGVRRAMLDVLVRASGLHLRPFPTREAALEWLLAEESQAPQSGGA